MHDTDAIAGACVAKIAAATAALTPPEKVDCLHQIRQEIEREMLATEERFLGMVDL